MGESILITGISGVGKSTIAKELSSILNIPHLCVGELLGRLAETKLGIKSRDEIKNLELVQILELHNILKDYIQEEIKKTSLTILDDHLTPFSKGKHTIKLPSDYISQYSIKIIFVVTSPPHLVLERKNIDQISRKRPIYSENEVMKNQQEIISIAGDLANKNDIPLYIVENIQVSTSVYKIENILSNWRKNRFE